MAHFDDRERFIPVSKNSLIQALSAHYNQEDKAMFEHFVDILESLYHFKFHSLLECLKDAYEPFNPDPDVTSRVDLSEEEEEDCRQNLLELLDQLLERGNFNYLNEQDLSDLLHEHGSIGIRIEVDPDQYRHFALYVRGEGHRTEEKRTWYTLWLGKKKMEVAYYKRVVILLRGIRMEFAPFWKRFFYFCVNFFGISSSRTLTHRVELQREINLKVFKDIRKDSLQMLFPYVHMRMGLLDRFRIGVPLAGGVFVILVKIFLAAALSPIAILILLGSFFGYIISSILGYQTTKELYIKKLTENLYYNSLDSNQGVFSYLIDSAEEEELKEALLALHFLWNKEFWSFSHVTIREMDNRIEQFLQEVFGIEIDFDGDDALQKLGCRDFRQNLMDCHNGLEASHSPLGLLVKPEEPSFFLSQDALKGDRVLFLKNSSNLPLPLQGILEVELEDNSTLLEVPFVQNSWKFHLRNSQFGGGARLPHPLGSSIVWEPESPFETELLKDLAKNHHSLHVLKKNPSSLPLSGKGFLGAGDKKWFFRYKTTPYSNELQCVGALGKKYTPSLENPILVKIEPPYFKIQKDLPKGALVVPVDKIRSFPSKGVIEIQLSTKKSLFHSFVTDIELSSIQLDKPLPQIIPKNSLLYLSNPTGFLSQDISFQERSLYLKNANLFRARGFLKIASKTSKEERCEFRREIFELEFESPPKKKHPLGSTILIYSDSYSLKVKLLHTLDSQKKRLLVHGSLPFPEKGRAIFEPGTHRYEELEFCGHSKLLYLPKGTTFSHSQESLVQEESIASPISHPIYPFSSTIIVEDSSHFPLEGKAFLEQNGKILEGPFLYRRFSEKNHHTLILIQNPPHSYSRGDKVTIQGVETFSESDLHQDELVVEANFSHVANFPLKGKLIFEEGTIYEEKFNFERNPRKIDLLEALPKEIPSASKCKLTYRLFSQLAKEAPKGSFFLKIEHASFFPEKGLLQIGSQKINYKKKENILFLNSSVAFHHSQESKVGLQGFSRKVMLLEPAKIGERRITIDQIDGIPKEGLIYLGKGSEAKKYHFRLKENVLFLNKSLESSYSKKTAVFFPDFTLKHHLSPGDTFVEVGHGKDLPQEGCLIVEPDSSANLTFFGKNIFKKIIPTFLYSREELLWFSKAGQILWLDLPLSESLPKGEKVELLSYLGKNFGNLNPLPVNKACIWLDSIWDNIFVDSNEFRGERREPGRTQRRQTAREKLLKTKKLYK